MAFAEALLRRQFREMQTQTDMPGISCGLVDDADIFCWDVMLMLPDDLAYYGGANFRAQLTFPRDYPLQPPKLKFLPPAVPFHPNVYADGDLCISILHPPGEDEYGHESASERWSPAQTPGTILLSVMSLLASPSDSSPANVDAAVLWREEQEGKHREFRRRVRQCVRLSLGED